MLSSNAGRTVMRPSPSKALSKNTKLKILLLSLERNCFNLCVLFRVSVVE